MGRTQCNWTSNELERVHILVIKLKHPIFAFKRINIEPNRAFTRFTELLIAWTDSNIVLQMSNERERVHLLLIQLKHPIFGYEWWNIEL